MFVLPECGKLGLVTRVHCGSARSPLSGAHFTILVCVLECLDKSESLVDIATDWQIIDGDVTNDTLIIDDVCGSEGNASIISILNEAAVLLRDLLRNISDHWDVHLAEAANLAVLLCVLHVGEVRVDRGSNDLAVGCLEIL